MQTISNYYAPGSLRCAAFAAALYFACSNKDTSPALKILISAICAIAAYALSYPICSNPCVYSSQKYSPLDCPEFKAAFNQAFDRLCKEDFIHIGNFGPFREQKQRDHFYQEALQGICFGRAALFLQTINKNPHLSPTKIAQSIDMAEIIYLQLRYDFESRRVALSRTQNSDSAWFPIDEDKIASFAIPWKEMIQVIHSPVKREKDWIETFHALAQESGFKGRMSFHTCSTSGHTFSFWSSDNQFSYFDQGNVYEYADSKTFCKAVRDAILYYRRAKKESERQIYEYFPVAVLIPV